ncbi:MAG: hypothetical protein ABI237_17670 [Ginsengibacter sp.]
MFFNQYLLFHRRKGVGATYVKDFKTYGYINGIRLDSINSGYPSFGKRGQSLFFDYGQGASFKEMLITDKSGLLLIFPTDRRRVLWLNFFYFNGWEYVPDTTVNLLKKHR